MRLFCQAATVLNIENNSLYPKHLYTQNISSNKRLKNNHHLSAEKNSIWTYHNGKVFLFIMI